MKTAFLRNPPNWLIWLIAAVLALGSGAALWLLVIEPRFAAKTGTQDVQSDTTSLYSTVTRGDLTTETSATGTLVAKTSYDLSFVADGKLASLDLQVGEHVTAGQVLATQADTELLEIAVDTRQIELNAAQKTLSNLLNGGDAALAEALSEQAEAQAVYQEAFEALRRRGQGRCETAVTQAYWSTYFTAKRQAEGWEALLDDPTTGYGHDFILDQLEPIQERRDQAYINWKYCEGFSEQEVLESEAALQLATAERDLAEQKYQTLLAETGIDPIQEAILRAKVNDAQMQLEKAEAELAGAVITAPQDGVVTAVNVEAGDDIKAGRVVISMVDPAQVILQASVDEDELTNFFEGCSASVVFESLTERTFNGTVTQVLPVISSSFAFSTATGYIELDSTAANPEKDLPLNLTGSVEITCQVATDALLIPATALQSTADGSYTVQVVNLLGQIETQAVEVGKFADMLVEITSGLSEGQRIVTLPEAASLAVTQ